MCQLPYGCPLTLWKTRRSWMTNVNIFLIFIVPTDRFLFVASLSIEINHPPGELKLSHTCFAEGLGSCHADAMSQLRLALARRQEINTLLTVVQLSGLSHIVPLLSSNCLACESLADEFVHLKYP